MKQLLIELLDRILLVLTELCDLQDQKRRYLACLDSQRLLDSSKLEAELASRLRELIEYRSRVLFTCRMKGIAAQSLTELARICSKGDQKDLEPKLAAVGRKTREIRRAAIANWLCCSRLNSEFDTLLNAFVGAPNTVDGPTLGGHLPSQIQPAPAFIECIA